MGLNMASSQLAFCLRPKSFSHHNLLSSGPPSRCQPPSPTLSTTTQSLRKTFGLASLENAILTIATLTIAIVTITSVSKQHCPCHRQASNVLRFEEGICQNGFPVGAAFIGGRNYAVQVCAWIWLSTAAKLQLALAKFSLDEKLKNIGSRFWTKYSTPQCSDSLGRESILDCLQCDKERQTSSPPPSQTVNPATQLQRKEVTKRNQNILSWNACSLPQ